MPEDNLPEDNPHSQAQDDRSTVGSDAKGPGADAGGTDADETGAAGPSEEYFDGRYRLLDIVGEGGMAVVWRAEDSVLERQVAIKVLRPQYASDPEFVGRFRSEARAAAALNHPGIVGVYDVGESAEGPYLVMEFVPGKDLKELIRAEAPLPVARAVAVASAIAHAVDHAHKTGLVHRDIKPQNVLIARDSRMKVADFGIARAVSAVGTTAPGIVLGTVHYLSPEQASGGPSSPASDVYSLGVVLYEMLTGSVPHEADSQVGVAMKIVNEEPEPVDSLNPRVPAVLAGIVAKAMARRPEDRYADAGALAEALDGFARWSEQATGALRSVPKSAAAPGVPATSANTPIPTAGNQPTRTAHVPAASGPMLDGTGLLLAVVALIAVLGLIPLWLAVLDTVEPSQVQAFLGIAPAATAAPTAEPSPTPPEAPPEVAVPVPEVRGLEMDAAIQRLTDEGLGYTWEVQESVTETQDVVLHQEPAASAGSVPGGTVVRLVVSGEPLITIPAMEGGYAAVAERLASIGLEPRRADTWGGSTSAAGAVLSIDPPPGSRVPRGSRVDITVNSGPWLHIGADFDGFIHLSGIELARDRMIPGETLTIVARWEATGDVERDLRTYAALIGPDGVVARDSHQPLGRSTATWAGGEIILGDAFNLTVPEGATTGAYQLAIGLETNDDGAQAIPLVSAGRYSSQGEAVIARTIVVGEPAVSEE